ncbi:FdtA/QdtA family cupin domain-containing protein [Streptomyces sp. TRM 70361]|uniref:sugar 3,4-ketoisomerase n=1 Tax=Streptomyces sp. TRM 70361 TaxID=3116553 RepID=UPI002E7B46DF|nr:FdtA/QdtA family cupin domain-containing protein [Streptomyces sp. TRM 70361]MEE1943323.1 FdtA/QdtA family cupin domain-containing protein [Streptomyces sp. TRM 70361]
MPPDQTPEASLAAVRGCRLVTLPDNTDPRGSLTVIERGQQVDFPIERVFFVHGVPRQAVRGLHMHRELHEFILAATGSFEVVVDDGFSRARVRLDRPDQALHVEPGVWTEFADFSPDAICLVLASAPYELDDYLYDYGEFVRTARLSGAGAADGRVGTGEATGKWTPGRPNDHKEQTRDD